MSRESDREMTEPKFMTFKEWLKANPDLDNAEDECLDCDGWGEIECFHCGQNMDCDTCGGTGKISNAEKIYKEQLEADKKRLKKAMQRENIINGKPH